ncbi:cyclin-dependent kinase 2-associated protein 1 isoform X2 [Trachypithecus francoisi]|nr:cyclin-dependent kinase 2-associated protein 1 isoform X2 [Trachypithecus francoisi]XP_033076090.1 cyclin-dependent kinase 2-associated protein 1 isoform X2 [Trachypithecus francoisi]XP_033076092.1 cyclin-dependent kinase 2-associated protein 1 isoform X2 [Trachypithecus francoisi]XP_033076093.1 cyclin-dependent kinase 2-associated protein 1 isoform X2 [Trachypithecus francoisi]
MASSQYRQLLSDYGPPSLGYTQGTGNSQVPQSKYAELLAIIEELGKEIRPTYAGSKSAMERLKREFRLKKPEKNLNSGSSKRIWVETRLSSNSVMEGQLAGATLNAGKNVERDVKSCGEEGRALGGWDC